MKNAKRLSALFLIAATLTALFSSCKADEHVCAFDVTEIVNAASCIEEGELARICSVCGKSETLALAPKGHILGNWKDNGAGEYTKTCTLCSETVASFEKYGTASKGLEYERGLRDHDFTLVGIGSCEDSVIVIPREMNGTPITEIGHYAFADCEGIEAVIIPDTVTSIGTHAFSGSSIQRIFISDSVKNIESSAFSECEQLSEIILPNSLTYLGEYVFGDSPNLKEIILPQSLTVLHDYAFANSSITSLSLPSGITKIGSATFKDCINLKSLSLPDTLTKIGVEAFKDCINLKNISLPETLTEIGVEAFAGCTSLADVVLPDSITFIGESAFSGCSSLTSVIIPKGVSTLSAQVFSDCTSLGKVYIHDELKSIHGTAFLGVNLSSVEFFITSGNDYLYKDGSSLIGRDPDAITLGSLLVKNRPDTVIIGSADGSIPTDEKITKIGACAFQGRSDLTHVVIPKNITSIGGGAFYDCPNIVSIRYEGTVAEWEKVSLGVKWYDDYPVSVVKCSDGEVMIEFD